MYIPSHILDNNSQREQLASRDEEAQTNTVTVVPVAGDLIIAHSMDIASRFRVWYAKVCTHLWFTWRVSLMITDERFSKVIGITTQYVRYIQEHCKDL
jgi:ABC-type Mn2+/Zn2+ transport system permease subunit